MIAVAFGARLAASTLCELVACKHRGIAHGIRCVQACLKPESDKFGIHVSLNFMQCYLTDIDALQ